MALQLRLPPELHDELRQLAEDEDRPLNRTILRVLRVGLDRYRDTPIRKSSGRPQDEG